MALYQTANVVDTKVRLTGLVLSPRVTFDPGQVRLQFITSPIVVVLPDLSASLGSAEATELLSYVDLATGDFTTEGAAYVRSLPFDGVGTVDDYF